MEKILAFLLFPLLLSANFVVKSYQEIRNENLVRQNYEESCGAASLATLLNLITLKQFSEKEILDKFDTSSSQTDMVSFLDLQKVSLNLGYKAQGYQINRDIFNNLIIPVIAKIEDDPRFPHFVVVVNYKGDFVTIYDPSFGKYIATKNQFYSIWDKHNNGGYVLIVEQEIKKEYKLNLPSVFIN